MSSLREIAKGGWHPKAKDGGEESWRSDFKGINQVVCLSASPSATNLADSHRRDGWERERTRTIPLSMNMSPSHCPHSRTPLRSARRLSMSNTTALLRFPMKQPRTDEALARQCLGSRSNTRIPDSNSNSQRRSRRTRSSPRDQLHRCRIAQIPRACLQATFHPLLPGGQIPQPVLGLRRLPDPSRVLRRALLPVSRLRRRPLRTRHSRPRATPRKGM